MKRLFVYFNRLFIFPLIKLFLIREIKGKENIPQNGNFISVANHTNNLDHWLIALVLNKRLKDVYFLGAKEGLKGFLLVDILYYLSDTIAINRKKIDRGKILEKIEEILRRNKIIVIYPEGKTNKGEVLSKAKTGAAELALKTGIPIVPLGISSKNLSQITITIGKPICYLKEKKLVGIKNKNRSDYYLLLREITDNIMMEISKLSGKPYIYGD